MNEQNQRAKVKWHGSIVCDHCDNDIQGELYDCATRLGPWATLCATCWPLLRKRPDLGTGIAQRYVQADDNSFYKQGG